MSLVSNDEIKRFLGIESSNTNNDNIITAVNAYVDSEVKGFLNREVEAVVGQVEIHNDFLDELQLKYFPVTDITSFVYGPSSTALVEGTDYDYDSETGIVFNLGSHLHYRRKITITYNHGYATVPDKIKMAAIELAALYYQYFSTENTDEDPILTTFNVASVNSQLGDITVLNRETYEGILNKLRRWKIRRVV